MVEVRVVGSISIAINTASHEVQWDPTPDNFHTTIHRKKVQNFKLSVPESPISGIPFYL